MRWESSTWTGIALALLILTMLVSGGAHLRAERIAEQQVQGRAHVSGFRLVAQARLDTVLDRPSMAFTDADDEEVQELARRAIETAPWAANEILHLQSVILGMDPRTDLTLVVSALYEAEKAALRPLYEREDRARVIQLVSGGAGGLLTGAALVTSLRRQE